MNRRTFITAAMLVLTFLFDQRASAQIDTSTINGLYNYIFAKFNRSRVPTGYLEEYGAPMIPMETFNGVLTDSNRIDMNLWRTLYWQMQTAFLGTGTNAFASFAGLNANIDSGGLIQHTSIPVPILLGTFNSVSPTAFSSNELQIVSNQLVDGPNNSNPYLTNNLFAVCPSFAHGNVGNPSFVVPANLIYNNTGKSIASLTIDLGDGAGSRAVTISTPFTASYSDTGWHTWTISALLSDHSTLQCYSKYYVGNASASGVVLLGKGGRASGAAAFENRVLKAPAGMFDYNPYQLDATIPVPYSPNWAGAYVQVQYSTLNTSKTMQKPLIVIEGYDVAAAAPDLSNYYYMTDFINAIGNPYTSPYDLSYNLDNVGGYDLVFVTFYDGTDDITRNAAMVENIIQQVNTLKAAAGSTQQNVVMGLSMGGLVARYALADMTKKSIPTGTRLLITHDSPHQGGNVPLGLQYLLYMIGNINFFGNNITSAFPEYSESLGLLNHPATQELLLYTATGPNTYMANTFLSGTYRNMITFKPTDPQPSYQFIASSDGSQCGQQLFAPGTQLISLKTSNFLFLFPIVSYRLALNAAAYAMPATGSTATIASVNYVSKFKLFGLITISKTLYNNSQGAPGTQLPVDGAPGGTNGSLYNIPIPTISPFSIVIPTFLFGWLSASSSGPPPPFSFVPAASALDVSPFNSGSFSQKFIDGVDPYDPSTSSTFIAQEAFQSGSKTLYNNTHIQFTPRNGQWLFDEMQGIANTINCTSECSTGLAITGPTAFCGTASYSVNLPSATGLTWGVTPSGVVTPTFNGTSASLTKNSAGSITLSAGLNSCYSTSLGISTSPIVSNITYYMSGGCNGTYQSWYLSATANMPNPTNWQWTLANPNNTIYFSNSSSSSTYADVSGGGAVNVSYKDACGETSALNGVTIYSTCHLSAAFSMSPNPATGSVTIQTVSPVTTAGTVTTASAGGMTATEIAGGTTSMGATGRAASGNVNPKAAGTSLISAVKVTDLAGNVRLMRSYSPAVGYINLSLRDIPSGHYYLSIFDGTAWTSQLLMVK